MRIPVPSQNIGRRREVCAATKAVIERFPLNAGARSNFSHGLAASPTRKFQIKRSHPTSICPALLPIAICGRRDDLREPSKIESRVAAHAVASGRLFESIVRHAWRIAALAKRAEPAVALRTHLLARDHRLVTIATNAQARALRQAEAMMPSHATLPKMRRKQLFSKTIFGSTGHE
jgi:hypothetical protein